MKRESIRAKRERLAHQLVLPKILDEFRICVDVIPIIASFDMNYVCASLPCSLIAMDTCQPWMRPHLFEHHMDTWGIPWFRLYMQNQMVRFAGQVLNWDPTYYAKQLQSGGHFRGLLTRGSIEQLAGTSTPDHIAMWSTSIYFTSKVAQILRPREVPIAGVMIRIPFHTEEFHAVDPIRVNSYSHAETHSFFDMRATANIAIGRMHRITWLVLFLTWK